jgi:hypothetical protein
VATGFGFPVVDRLELPPDAVLAAPAPDVVWAARRLPASDFVPADVEESDDAFAPPDPSVPSAWATPDADNSAAPRPTTTAPVPNNTCRCVIDDPPPRL